MSKPRNRVLTQRLAASEMSLARRSTVRVALRTPAQQIHYPHRGGVYVKVCNSACTHANSAVYYMHSSTYSRLADFFKKWPRNGGQRHDDNSRDVTYCRLLHLLQIPVSVLHTNFTIFYEGAASRS